MDVCFNLSCSSQWNFFLKMLKKDDTSKLTEYTCSYAQFCPKCKKSSKTLCWIILISFFNILKLICLLNTSYFIYIGLQVLCSPQSLIVCSKPRWWDMPKSDGLRAVPQVEWCDMSKSDGSNQNTNIVSVMHMTVYMF